jgi:hypothetical protein
MLVVIGFTGLQITRPLALSYAWYPLQQCFTGSMLQPSSAVLGAAVPFRPTSISFTHLLRTGDPPNAYTLAGILKQARSHANTTVTGRAAVTPRAPLPLVELGITCTA